MLIPFGARSEKAVALAEAAAADWLAERGLLLGSGSGSGRVVADAYRTPDFAIARLWLDTREVERSPSEAGGVSVTIVTEGSVTALSPDGGTHDLDRGDATISRRSIGEVLTSAAPIALLSISLEKDFLVRYALRDIGGTLVARGRDAPVMILATLVNSTLSSMNVMDLSWEHSRTAVEASTAALLTLARSSDRSATSSGSAVFDDAALIIAEKASDPLFTVSSLAARLRISERRLQEVFAMHGTSPRAAIGHRRLREAKRLLAQYPAVDAALLSEIARLSGYKSTRSLREALRAESRRPGWGE